MIDGVIAGNGKSRYLKSDISADMTWEDFRAALRIGTVQADLSGFNPDGWTQIGTPLNKENLSKLVPAGVVLYFASTTPPEDFLECDGAAISRSTYSGLFAVIGTTFGAGDGSTTFNLPDLRGEFMRGFDHGRGIDIDRVFGSPQASTGLVRGTAVATVTRVLNPDGSTSSSLGQSSGNDTGTNASTTYTIRPRNVALLPCIKY